MFKKLNSLQHLALMLSASSISFHNYPHLLRYHVGFSSLSIPTANLLHHLNRQNVTPWVFTVRNFLCKTILLLVHLVVSVLFHLSLTFLVLFTWTWLVNFHFFQVLYSKIRSPSQLHFHSLFSSTFVICDLQTPITALRVFMLLLILSFGHVYCLNSIVSST